MIEKIACLPNFSSGLLLQNKYLNNICTETIKKVDSEQCQKFNLKLSIILAKLEDVKVHVSSLSTLLQYLLQDIDKKNGNNICIFNVTWSDLLLCFRTLTIFP